jgi:hypothetical protein
MLFRGSPLNTLPTRLQEAFCLSQKIRQALEPQESIQSVQAFKTEQKAHREA